MFQLSSNILALLVFSCIVLVLFYLIPRNQRKYLLLAVSLLFYLLCNVKMFAVLLCAVLWTWFCGRKTQGSKKWLAAGCVPLVLILIFFKYNEFFIDSVNSLLETFGMASTSGVLTIMMPLGISYYIFKAISYLFDVYQLKYPAEANPVDYTLYLLYYAEIISGPISRYNDFKDALVSGMTYSEDKFRNGFYLIIKGLFMKAVIANRLSAYVAAVFAEPGGYNGISLWMAAFFYTVQLYCDFAGYSSIAVGITQLFGLHRAKNFVRPYFAINIRDFWDRWHISLSSWLKDYIYIPLGGSRCSKLRSKLNVLIVFLVSGLWHGSGLNFVVWGLYHGLLNIITPKTKKAPTGIKKAGMILLNFCAVTFGWIFFGTSSMGIALTYITQMFTKLSFSMTAIQKAILPFTNDNSSVSFFLLAMVFILILAIREWYEEHKKKDCYEESSFAWQVFLLTAVIVFGNFGGSGFIYANF